MWEGEIPSLVLCLPPLFQITPFSLLILPAWVHSVFYLVYSPFLSQTPEAQRSSNILCPHCSSRGVRSRVILAITRWKSHLLYKGRDETIPSLVSWGFFIEMKWMFEFQVLKVWRNMGKARSVGGFGWTFLERELDWKPQRLLPTFPCRVCRQNVTRHWGQRDAVPKLTHKPLKK